MCGVYSRGRGARIGPEFQGPGRVTSSRRNPLSPQWFVTRASHSAALFLSSYMGGGEYYWIGWLLAPLCNETYQNSSIIFFLQIVTA